MLASMGREKLLIRFDPDKQNLNILVRTELEGLIQLLQPGFHLLTYHVHPYQARTCEHCHGWCSQR